MMYTTLLYTCFVNEENKTLAASSLDCVRSCMPCLYVFVFVERHSRVQEKRSAGKDLILELLLVR